MVVEQLYCAALIDEFQVITLVGSRSITVKTRFEDSRKLIFLIWCDWVDVSVNSSVIEIPSVSYASGCQPQTIIFPTSIPPMADTARVRISISSDSTLGIERVDRVLCKHFNLRQVRRNYGCSCETTSCAGLG